MRSKNLIDYSIHLSSFSELPTTLQRVGSGGGGVVRLLLFSKCSDNREYVELYDRLKEEVTKVWGEQRPIITFISQPTLDSELVVEVHRVEGERIYREYESGGRSISIVKPFGEMLFIGELQGDVMTQSIEQQSKSIFNSARVIMGEIEAKQIVRQWNYIERITDMEGENQHYQLFNNARSEFYDECSWEGGYPAATGIGMDRGGVAVDIDIIIPTGDRCKITPIDNKLQIAAHAYSDQVLIDANNNKSTPKFERAKSVEVEGCKLTYISGTAAIEGEHSLATASAEAQTLGTLHNIDQLIDSRKDITLLRIYIKNSSDYHTIKRVVEQQIEQPIASAYMLADVCREELLVEIEGIAIN